LQAIEKVNKEEEKKFITYHFLLSNFNFRFINIEHFSILFLWFALQTNFIEKHLFFRKQWTYLTMIKNIKSANSLVLYYSIAKEKSFGIVKGK